jgi:hypothetical protein
MSLRSKLAAVVLLAGLSGLLLWPGLHAADRKADKADPKTDTAAEIKPEEREASIKKGLAYLADLQRPDGGWRAEAMFGAGTFIPFPGGVPAKPGAGAKGAQDASDVGCTCLALLVLVRAGNTTTNGDYSKNVAKAVDFLIHAVAKAEKSNMTIGEHNNTQLHIKIGPHVDTFLALLTLSELKGKLKDEKAEERLTAAVHKLVAKVEGNQKKDGTYAQNQGWAPVLSHGLASKALNRACQNGYGVKTQTLARDYEFLVSNLDRKTGRFGIAIDTTGVKGLGPARPPVTTKGSGEMPALVVGDAGVALYGSAARAAGLQELANTMRMKEDKAKAAVDDKSASSETRQIAKKQLELLDKADTAAALGLRGISGQLEDKKFIAGFGTNGGEEFLSFMIISEALHSRGGDDWEKWDKLASALVVHAQDKDGAWSGSHCITGRTACTAFSLLTLMADKAPAPGAKEADKKEPDKKEPDKK